MRHFGVDRFAAILIFLAAIGLSSTSDCKDAVRDFTMRWCVPGRMRTRRGIEKFELPKWEYQKEKPRTIDYLLPSDSHRKVVGKRQLPMTNLALPIVSDAIHGTIKSAEHEARRGFQNHVRIPPLGGSYYPYRGYYPPPLLGGRPSFRPPAVDFDLDFDLTDDELEEYYNEAFERVPRASKVAWKLFRSTAGRCCQIGRPSLTQTCFKDSQDILCTYMPFVET